jgi:AraC-like DNA-binding protein
MKTVLKSTTPIPRESFPDLLACHVSLKPGSRHTSAIGEWVLAITLAGRAQFAHADGALSVREGDVLIIRPDTPQAWQVPADGGGWECIYFVFTPDAAMLPWLQYREDRPGYSVLRVKNRAYWRRIARALRKAYRLAARTPFALRHALAMTAIAEALLWCREDHRLDGRSLDPRVERALLCLAQRIGDATLGLPDLVQAGGTSRARLMALFHRQIGLPPMAYLEKERLHRARRLLEAGMGQVKAVAAECGFADSKYFARRFRALYGMPPSAFRRRPS